MFSFHKIAAAFAALCFFSAFKSVDGPKKIVFFGDSITQAGVGKGGYIDRMNQLLQNNNLAANYQLIGAGISGNKVYDLYLRLEDDVLAKKPDVAVVWIGVNDVWHKRTHGTGTDAPKFEAFYSALIKKMQAQGIKVVLATPAAIGEKTDFTNELDGDLNRYAQLIRDLGARFNCPIADLRKGFLEYNLANNKENKESGILTSDRVHLNEAGNQFVADLFYKMLIN